MLSKNFAGLISLLSLLFVVGCSSGQPVKAQHAAPSTHKEMARHDFPYPSNYVEVKGSDMHYVDTGGDKPVILMLHGQPTWSYLWRNIIPYLEKDNRVIALDLIGFGKSDKPDIEYTIEDHANYLQGFIQALELKDMTLVIHDWGSFLGFDYAARHPSKVKGIAFMESVLPVDIPEPADSLNRKIMDNFFNIVTEIRKPGVGEKMILKDNFFIEKILLTSPGFSEDEKQAYREPFADGKNRLPMLQFPRQISFDGINPEYVTKGMESYGKYLKKTDTPMLMLTFSPGALIGQAATDWAKKHINNLTHEHIGEGVHFVQEDHPDAIGRSIKKWLEASKKQS